MDADTVLATYYDHYKDTNVQRQAAESRRNRSFVLLCILETLSFMMIWNSNFVCAVLNEAVAKKLETTIQFSNTIIQTLLWILIAYVLIRYVQNVLYVEKQYRYINALEHKISSQLGETLEESIFSREGDYYLKDYPMVLNFIDLFYKFFAPILFMVINISRIVMQWKSGGLQAALWCDTVICAAILIITWFYFFHIHSKITAWFMKCSMIRSIAVQLQKWLKEV